MSKAGFSISDLQQSAKKLNSVEVSDNKKTSKQTSHEDNYDIEATLALGNIINYGLIKTYNLWDLYY